MSGLHLNSATVAVIDTNPRDYDTLLAAAETEEVSIHFLFRGNDAIRFARRWPVGLWLINTRLPDMSGFDLAQMLRNVRPNALVFLIGDDYRQDEEIQTMTLGAAKYLCKPLDSGWIIPQGQDACVAFKFVPEVEGPRVFRAMDHQGTAVCDRESEVLLDETDDDSDGKNLDNSHILPFVPRSRRRPAA